MSSSKLKPSQSKENLKQKSLMAFFSKGPQTQTPATPVVKQRLQGTSSDAPPSSSPLMQTPKSRKVSSSSVISAALTGSSDGKSNRTGSPPPTSDAIDIDMLSDEEEEQPKKVCSRYTLHNIRFKFVSQRIKRKISLQDSDEDVSTFAKESGRTKKRRISRAPSEEPQENAETAIGKRAFTEKLQKFKKSPQKKAPCMRSFALFFRVTVDNPQTRDESQLTTKTATLLSPTTPAIQTLLPSLLMVIDVQHLDRPHVLSQVWTRTRMARMRCPK